MALTVVVGFAIIFLSTIQSLHVQHRFESRPFHYLNVSPLETLVANDYIDCSFACLQNVLCVSFNVAVFSDENGKRWCELLPSTSYNNTAKLTADHQSQHYSIQVGNNYAHNHLQSLNFKIWGNEWSIKILQCSQNYASARNARKV